MITKKRLLPLMTLLLCLMMPTISRAQYNKLFTSDNGLPSSLVNDITMDSDGMLWIATENGLSCSNGSSVMNYRVRKSEKHSLVNNFIRKICAGDNGRILLGTVDGVQIYDKHTNGFSEVVSTESIGVSTSNVNDIVRLHDGTYFVVGYDAYTIILDKDGTPHVKKNIMTGAVHSVDGAEEGKNGDIWCVSCSDGVWRSHGKKVSCIKDEQGRNYNFYTVCCGNDGRIYCGHTDAGLYVFNPKTNHFSLLPGTEYLKNIRDIKPLPNSDVLCIAMDGLGVRYYDSKKLQFIGSSRFYDPFVDISSQKAHALYVDSEGNIWMGLYQLGVYFASSHSECFDYYGPRSSHHNIIGDRCVTSIMQSYDGSVWVSTDNGGLYGIAPDGSALRHFVSSSGIDGLPTTLLGLFQDSRHRTWFGSFLQGSGMVNLTTGQCDIVPMKGVQNHIYSVYQYQEDNRGTIWAATMGHGIAYYDETSHIFKPFSTNDLVLWSDCLYYDSATDIFYAGTYDGVVWFYATDKGENLNKVCNGNVVYSISRISERYLAFSTSAGLIVFDTSSNAEAFTLTQADGLPDDNILAAQMGNDGKLWISSSTGIARYDMKTKDMEVFTVVDGLQGNEFYKNAFLRTHDGRLWFGGTNGITVFSPKGIRKIEPQQFQIRIGCLMVNETLVPRNAEGYFLLPDGNDSFTIELCANPIYMSRRIIYYYKLDNGEWQSLPIGQTRTTITGLSFGKHTIALKTIMGTDKSEIFTEEIYVPYPWYLSWWACIIWLIIATAFTLLIYNTLRRRHLLRQEIKKHQEEEALSEHKLSFFMNVVHDLRTPLSLIISPIQKLKQMDDDEAHMRLYAVIQKSAERMLRLSNEIMDIRKFNMGKMELHCREVNVSEMLYELINSMEDLADMRNQKLLTIDGTNGNSMVWMDPVAIEKVMLNLLGNAIKYTPQNGTITTQWNITDGVLDVMVTDNGNGIPDADKPKVFNSFFRRDVDTIYANGTGLGLSLVRSLIELHHGNISVEDNPYEHGTRMHFTLPVNADAYSKIEKTPLEQENPLADAVTISREPVTNAEQDATEQTVERHEETQKAPLHRRNILVVDDDRDIQEYLIEELSGTYNILSCNDGRQAYAMLQNLNNEKDEKKKIDIIVSDIMMPDIDGLELCHLIRNNVNLCHIPIVLLTAKSADPDRLIGLQASADAYITKPFNMEVLTATISNLLTRQETIRKKYKGVLLPVDSIETPDVKTTDDQFLDKLNKIISDNIANSDMTSDYIAKKLGMSRVHLYRRLKETTSQSCTNYIRNIRLAKAAEMLSHGKVPVQEVAERVGFKSLSHFSTAFRTLYGVTPTEYMK